MRTDRPNLDRARDFTRRVGPIAMASGGVSVLLSLSILDSPLAAVQPLAFGLVMTLFGWAAYARTETPSGRLAQWGVTLTFASGGVWSLLQWVPIIWGSHHASAGDNIQLIAIWLTMGPALFVPGLLAAIRPGWTPLIVIPAIVSLAFAATVGFALAAIGGLPGVGSVGTLETIVAISLSAVSGAFLAIAARHAREAWRS